MAKQRNAFRSGLCIAATIALATLGVLALITGHRKRPLAMRNGPLDQQAYLWQRHWNASTRQGVIRHGRAMQELLVLGGELDFAHDHPQIALAHYDAATLEASGVSVGLALRIGEFRGPFQASDQTTRLVLDLSRRLVQSARTSGLKLVEFQVDFDCGERQLGGYRVWISALQKALKPLPVTFTALPSWLNRAHAFLALARASDGYVLQVHSLSPPPDASVPMNLCSIRKSQQWVNEAAALGVPFRVSLPTYSYLLAFNPAGKICGITAEGGPPDWPPGTHIRLVRANPGAMATLVRHWTACRPVMLRGIVWYRFPNNGDTLNWHWPTLAAVMRGITPVARMQTRLKSAGPGLINVLLVNTGTADSSSRFEIVIQWPGEPPIATDSLDGFSQRNSTPHSLTFRPGRAWQCRRFFAGRRYNIGWLKFKTRTVVSAHVYSIKTK